jgi:hypothetical protein
MSACRECGEEVTWVRTPNGKRMPVQEDETGVLVLMDEGDDRPTTRRYNPGLYPEHVGKKRYECHFDFCGYGGDD